MFFSSCARETQEKQPWFNSSDSCSGTIVAATYHRWNDLNDGQAQLVNFKFDGFFDSDRPKQMVMHRYVTEHMLLLLLLLSIVVEE